MKYTLIVLAIVTSLSLKAQMIEKEKIYWPDSISFARISFPDKFISQYQYDNANPCKIEIKTYFHPNVIDIDTLKKELPFIHTGPTVATVIEYYEKYNTFYVRFDCRMGHGDYAYGPFSGDPKVVLNPKM